MRVGIWLILAACGSAPATMPPTNTAATPPRLVIPADRSLGWIGFAPAIRHDWLPKSMATVNLVTDVPPSGRVIAIDEAGKTERLVPGRDLEVSYGCDGNHVDVKMLDGNPSLRGLVWVLPVDAPAEWAPQALAIESMKGVTATNRRYTVGPILIELVRTGDTTGSLAFAWKGRVVFTRPIERGEMAGAPTDPINFAEGGPAVPEPVAAWQIGRERGVVLVVIHEPGYEGENVRAVLVDEDRGRVVDALGFYLYRCAF